MRFAHVSDLHLGTAVSVEPAELFDVSARAKAVAADLARISAGLDFIVISGDLTEDAHPGSFAAFEQLFSPLALPVFTIPGNHDGPSAYLREAESGYISQCDITGRLVELGAVRLLGLNTCLQNETTGALSPGALERVARELGSASPSQLIIVMHHPPFQPGLREFDAIAKLEGAEDLAVLLRAADVAPIILCGHVHRVYQARWNGAACFVAGSPTLPFSSKLPFGNSPVHAAVEAGGYFVHSLGEDGTHIVTPQSPAPDASAA